MIGDRAVAQYKCLKSQFSQESAFRFFIVASIFLFYFGLIFNFFHFLSYGLEAIHYPYQIDYGEGVVLNQTMSIFDLSEVYSDIDQFPHNVVLYPPMFHAFVQLITFDDALIAGRLTSFIATILTGVLIGLIASWVTSADRGRIFQLAGACIAGLIYFSFGPVFRFAPLMRVDLFAVFLSFMGIYLFLHSSRYRHLL